MHRPYRGASSDRFARAIAFVCAALAALAAVTAGCVSRGTLTAPPEEVTTETPAGCERTVCDYFDAWCVDPCGSCWESCGRENDQLSVIRCSQTCNAICTVGVPPSPAECEKELAACRSTHHNAVCIDHLTDEIPKDHPACSLEMNVAACSCGDDVVCLGVLDRLNHKCRKCNQDWVGACIDAACKRESEALHACLRAKKCSNSARCADCASAAEAVTACVASAQEDTSDVGGCYSGPRGCSGQPLCPFIPF